MEFNLSYGTREALRTVSVECELTARSAEAAIERLRAWALLRHVPVGDGAFLRLPGPLIAFAHLPICAEVMPHPQTGLSLDRAISGPAIAAEGVLISEARAVARALQYEFGPSCGLAGAAEFHAQDRRFGQGTVVLPVNQLPSRRPAVIAIPHDDPGPRVPVPMGPRDVRVVTVARQAGAGGEEVARIAAAQLGFRYVDWEVFQTAAREAGVSVETIAEHSRRHGLLARIFESFAWVTPDPSTGIVRPGPASPPVYSTSDYRSFVEEAITRFAAEGNVVIVGHGASLVLGGRADTLRVLVTGSIGRRAERLRERGATDSDDPHEIIRRADRERLEYFNEFYSDGWLSPPSYDLCINTDRFTAEQGAALIDAAITSRTTARPGRAAAHG